MQRVVCGLVFAVVFLLLGCSSAGAAIERPNAFDRRVDALTQTVLMREPATALVDQARQAAAVRRAHWTVFGWVLISVFEGAALLWLWSSGAAAALRDRLRRRTSTESAARFAFGAALALVARLAALLPSFYLFRVDRTLQISTELTRAWAAFWIFHTVVGMVVAGLIAAVVLWLAERTHQWYVYTIIAVLAASAGWSYASPYVEGPMRSLHPLGNTQRAPLDALLARGGLTQVPILESDDNSGIDEVQMRAVGPARRVVLSHSLVAGDTAGEIEYRVAYELGRIAQGDLLSIALIEGGVIVVFAAIAIAIADGVRFRRDDDSLSRLTIVGALFAFVYLAAVPARNAALRSYVLDADRYAVATTGDPSAAVRALVRESDQRMQEVCPEGAATLFLYTTPGIGARIAAINRVPDRCP